MKLYGGLFAGVVAVSWAAIFIRLTDAPALSIAAWRLTFAALPVAGFALIRHRQELLGLTGRQWLLLASSGVALALHFATWIASLELTTVASSVALVTTQPLWVALLAWTALGEPVSRLGALAILIATAGGLVIGGADIAVSGEALIGDLLALLGALFAALYFVVGRRVRPAITLATYVAVVYSVAALVLLPAAALSGAPLTGFAPSSWLMLAAMALVSQLIGHSLLNWALRYSTASFVSVTILGEPVLSTALAIPILGEYPGPVRVAGGAVILLGVYLAVRDESEQSRRRADLDRIMT